MLIIISGLWNYGDLCFVFLFTINFSSESMCCFITGGNKNHLKLFLTNVSGHAQSRDQCMRTTWSVRAQSHVQCLSVTDHCLINTWSVHDEPCDQCPISPVISACAVTSSVNDSHVISACRVPWSAPVSHWYLPDKHVISAWWAMWSVPNQPRHQCMRSHVISAW